MTPQETIDQLILYIDQAIERGSVSNRQVAAVLDFLNSKLKSQEGGVSRDELKGKGSDSLPVWFDSDGVCHVILSLDVPGAVIGRGGVSAMGISDLSISPTGTANLDVVPMDDLSEETYEDLNRVPSAYSVKQMMEHIGIDRLTEFDDEEEYSRGDAVRHNGKGYRFNTHKSKGAWDPSYCDRVDYLTLLSPLEVTNDFIDSLSI